MRRLDNLHHPDDAGLDAPLQRVLEGMAPDSSFLVPAATPNGCVARSYTVLFALLPGSDAAGRIVDLQHPLVQALGLIGQIQRPDRLHVTLCSVDDLDRVPRQSFNAAVAAVNSMVLPAVHLMFDRAQSFKAGGAFALYGTAATATSVARLRRPLMAALRRHGLPMTESRTPHMSLVYGCGAVVPATAIPPLAWTAQRLVLILSHVGCTHHEVLAEWPLPG